MLKMTIDNEEVVSDKDITINEEMLSASSTILNNVYPKEWEEDKDYTSRFYYPQDYSKALIQRSYVTQEAEAGTTIQVNGSVTLTDVDTTKNSRVLRLLGQTSQTGTPTPSSPIPVNVVSGDNKIDVVGKNLYKVDNTPETTKNGITYSIENGTITLNGTATAHTDINLSTTYLLNANTYTISTNVISGSYTGTVGKYVRKKVGSGYSVIIDGSVIANTRTVTTSESTDMAYSALYVVNGATFSNYKINIQLEKGSSATTYEPYQGNTYNIDLPVENLFDKSSTPISNASTTMSELDTGVRATVTSAGNNRYSAYKLSNSDSLLGKTLNISATITTSGTNNAYIRFYWLNGNTLTSLIAQTINSTGNANFDIPSSYPSGSNGIAILFSSNASGTSSVGDYVDYTNVMLTYDKYKGKYTPYGTTPIELCKIGNYQDYIYKDGDKWYLHKEIGKVIYTGASNENWGTGAYGTNSYKILLDNPMNITDTTAMISNLFKGVPYSERASAGNNIIYFDSDNAYIRNTSYTSLADFKTMLGTTNMTLYYVLRTPTNTEITYQPLIDQLNALSSQ